MAELTQRMIDAGAVGFDSNGIPIGADGNPVLEENQVQDQGLLDVIAGQQQGDPLAGIRAQMAAAQQQWDASSNPPTQTQMINGSPFPEDPLGYGFGPFYGASPQDYPDNRTPLTPDPEWDRDAPGAYEQYYTPDDRSTGGGFFTAQDWFGENQVPMGFQQGASSMSTNNYRLLPPPYNTPRYVMRNGVIIDRQATDLFGPGVVDGGWVNRLRDTGPRWSLDQTAGYPASYSYGPQGLGFYGWPGSVSNWASGGFGNLG